MRRCITMWSRLRDRVGRAYGVGVGIGWPDDGRELEAVQEELARSAATVPGWWPPGDLPIAIGGLFVASSLSGADRCWVGACVVRARRALRSAVVSGEPGAPYFPGHLALREGPLLERAVRELDGAFDALNSGFPHQGSLGRGGHGFRCGPTMFRKQVSGLVDSLDPPSWPAEAEQVERTRRRTWSQA